MLNIAICDDDDLIAHQIESVLHNIGDEENVKIDTDVFYSGTVSYTHLRAHET